MAGAAVALFVLAQPRVFCAMHCMILEPLGVGMSTTTAAASAGVVVSRPAARVPMSDMACTHSGTIVTSSPSIPVASVGPATLAAVELPRFEVQTPVPAAAPRLVTPRPATPFLDTPPPRA